jgi:hypothetical protein
MEESETSNPGEPSRQPGGEWAGPVSRLEVHEIPAGATNINLAGQRLATPLKGFGPLWRKTYRLRLEGLDVTPEQVVANWKANFPKYQPPENRFYPTMAGIRPGELIFIDGKVPPFPGMPAFLPVSSGVLVLYADETSFSIVTPEGFPEAGYNTWSAYRDPDGVTVAQVQTLARTADPLYEFCYRVLGVSAHQDHIWTHVLTSLAGALGKTDGKPVIQKDVIDPRLQWKEAASLPRNAAMRTVFYLMAAPLRWMQRTGKSSPKNQN